MSFARILTRKRLWVCLAILVVAAGWITWRWLPAGPLVVVPYLGPPPMPEQNIPVWNGSTVPPVAVLSEAEQIRGKLPLDLAKQGDQPAMDAMDTSAMEAASWSVESLESSKVTYDTLVVCPPAWQATLEPWLQYRNKQGYRIGLVEPPQAPQQLKDLLQQMRSTGLRFVLLVGDVPTLLNMDASGLPTSYVASEVSKRFGGRDRVPSDHWYADLDDDGAPELAIGRWSVQNTEQLQILIDKTIRFETDPDVEFAKRRIEFVAGVGGFGALEDKVIETTATRMLSELIPKKFTVGMTHASWRSIYCPGPDQYCDKVFESLNRGALFWVYIGHGSWNCLDSAHFPDRVVPTITTGNSEQISSATSPIALLLACSTGQFDMRQDCLAETMLRAPNGPVSVVAGTGVTAPYGLANFGLELLTLHGEESCAEVGTWFQQAKRRMVLAAHQRRNARRAANASLETASGSAAVPEAGLSTSQAGLRGFLDDEEPRKIDYREVLHQLAWWLSPTRDILEQEILEHADMMTYFGDPLLRFPKFETIEMIADVSNGQLDLVGHVPNSKGGPFAIEVEVAYPLDQLAFQPKARRKYESSESFSQQMAADYAQANDRIFHRTVVSAAGGRFVLPMASIGPLPNRFLVRAVANHADIKAIGFSEVTLQEPTPVKPTEPERVVDLFDGKTITGWKPTKFGGEGEALIEDQSLVLEMGQVLTGISYAGNESLGIQDMPRDNYELRIRAKRIDGNDMFCGVTFPVGEDYCSFIVGGWGGMTVGLSSVDEKDAARNPTRTVHKFELNQWYDIRVKVSSEQIQCWIDEQQVVDQPRAGHKFSIRQDVDLSKPLGLFCFQTTAAYEKIQLVIPGK
ncbi:MAG: DUF1080 domain-containing protein [Planctomycetaceae bacterium]|nr:DUF1080 domain-containing protein [Planctomycetaceae bacterium]